MSDEPLFLRRQSRGRITQDYTEAINFGNDDIDKAHVDWKKEIEEYQKMLMRNERNNGREDMAEAIRQVWSAKLYRNDLTADDLIMSAKLYLQNKGK